MISSIISVSRAGYASHTLCMRNVRMRALRLCTLRMFRVAVIAWIPLLSGVGCSSPDLSGAVSPDPTQLPWTLSLNAHAITMSMRAPYDTLQLTAVPNTVAGTPLGGALPATFTSSDSSVRISPTGLLTARAPITNVQVIATVVYQGIRISDTAIVNVTADVTPAASLRIQLQPGDSAKVAAFDGVWYWIRYGAFSLGRKTVQVGVFDAADTRLQDALVALRTSDGSRIDFGFGALRTVTTDPLVTLQQNGSAKSRPGPVTVYASAIVYGVPLQDSLQLQITDHLLVIYTVTKSTPPGSTTPVFTLGPAPQPIGVGGYVWWNNGDQDPADSLDIVFDDPTAASPDLVYLNTGGGDIAAFPGGDFNQNAFNPGAFVRSRQFLRAGTFHFHSVRTGVSGTVVVR